MIGVATVLPAVCAGFLLAVLWMDLIFDAQVLAHRGSGSELPDPVLASIAGYYHRATTSSRPMSTLVAVVMVALLAALVVWAVCGHGPWWLIAASAALAGAPIVLALVRTVPHAVRLGRRTDSPAEQSRFARSIFRDHLVCFGSCWPSSACGWPTLVSGGDDNTSRSQGVACPRSHVSRGRRVDDGAGMAAAAVVGERPGARGCAQRLLSADHPCGRTTAGFTGARNPARHCRRIRYVPWHFGPADDTKPYLDYVRDPDNGYVSVNFAARDADSMEISCRATT